VWGVLVYGLAIPAAFAWTGTRPMFDRAGFKPVGPRDGAKQRMRKGLGRIDKTAGSH